MNLQRIVIEPVVRAALLEDIGHGNDITTDSIVAPDQQAHARFVARESGIVAGLDAVALTFELLANAPVDFSVRVHDGERIRANDIIAEVRGSARVLLTGERTALNILSHLSGIATATRALVDVIARTNAHVVCTRKTLPGLRILEKYAVRCGGGSNHRFGLDDAVLIKDNHLLVAGSIHAAVTAARVQVGHMVKVEIEVDTLEQLREALSEPIDAVLLDNMSPAQLTEAVSIVADFTKTTGKHILTEASGGINPDTILQIARSGVDCISVGRITHSAPSLDIGLDFTRKSG